MKKMRSLTLSLWRNAAVLWKPVGVTPCFQVLLLLLVLLRSKSSCLRRSRSDEIILYDLKIKVPKVAILLS
jgi:hypothetical protein